MKRRVELSNFCFMATVVCLALLVGCTFIVTNAWWMITWGAFVSIVLIIALYYAPLSLEVTQGAVIINRAISPAKRLALSEIKSVQLYVPDNAIRTCGSGGFLGYWGWFTARGVGKYFAYHGRISDCFLVEMKDGRKYLLGCKGAKDMAAYISQSLQATTTR